MKTYTYVVEFDNGYTFAMESHDNQNDWFIDSYLKGKIARLWINGSEYTA